MFYSNIISIWKKKKNHFSNPNKALRVINASFLKFHIRCQMESIGLNGTVFVCMHFYRLAVYLSEDKIFTLVIKTISFQLSNLNPTEKGGLLFKKLCKNVWKMLKNHITKFNSYLLTEEKYLADLEHCACVFIHGICNVCQMHSKAGIKITG